MTPRMPVVFVSHGSPDALLKAPDAVAIWRTIGHDLPKPQAILAVSAHWETRVPTLSRSKKPPTIHDFSGFSAELYQLDYPAAGSPELAERASALVTSAGIANEFHADRGLDHGAWVPLLAMYPEAKLPVTQLSLIRHGDAAAHFALGQALAPLRDENVLILCSGAITHNFSWLSGPAAGAAIRPEALAFSDWMGEQLSTRNTKALLDYRSAPYGAESHPSEEHILPLFVALGASNDKPPKRYQADFAYGGLSMDAYVW